jgi:membrane protein
MRRLKLIFILVKKAIQGWGDDNASQLAAALAYYTIFSIPPILIIALSVVGHFFDTATAQAQLISQIGGFIGQGTADFIESLLENSTKTSAGLIASIISAGVLLAGALGIFYQIQYALNKIWKVPKKLPLSLLKTIKDYTLSFLVILGIGALFLVILILSSVVSVLIGNVNGLTQNVLLLEISNFFVLFITITIMFAIIFRVIPDKSITWGDVWLGASVTGLLFMLGKYAIGFYLTFTKSGSTYGAAGALIVLLVWVYYSVQIFLLGAEFTHVYSTRLGSLSGAEPVKPSKPEKTDIKKESAHEG